MSSRPLFRPRQLCAALALALAVPAALAQQAAAGVRSFNLPAQPLNAAISQIASESGLRVSLDAELARDKTAAAVHGELTGEQALQRALAGTGLELVRTGSGVLTLRRATTPAGIPAAVPAANAAAALAEVRVVAEADRPATTEGSGSWTADAATIGKSTLSLREIPQSVSVITRERMQAQGLRTLNEVLAASTGVTITMSDPDRMQYYVRGYAVDALQFDGMAFSPSPSTGGMLVQTDTAVLDRIEVLRGSAGLLQGTGNPSASINLVRKRPLAGFGGSAALTVGRWDRYRAEADLSTPLNAAGTVRGRMVAAHDDSKSFMRSYFSDRRTLYGVVEADLGPSTRATVGVNWQDQKTTGAWYGLRARADGSLPSYLPRDAFMGTDWARWSRDNTDVFAELEHQFDNAWKFKASLNTTRMDLYDFRQTFYSGSFDPVAGGGLTISPGTGCDYNDRQKGWELTASGPFALLGRTHELLVGASGRLDRITNPCASLVGTPATGVDPRSWDPSSMPEPPAPVYDGSGSLIDTKQHGAYATARFTLADPLKLIVGARLSSYRQTRTDTNAAGAQTLRTDYRVTDEISPYAGLVYELDAATNLYASYADVFRPQSALDRSGNILDPITGASYEVGVKRAFFDRKLNASFALFRIVESKRAMTDLDGPSPCPYSTGAAPAQYCSVASGKTRSQGFEFEVSGQAAAGLNLFAGYTGNMTKYLRDRSNEGAALHSQTPRHILRTAVDWRLRGALSAWSVGASTTTQSKAFNANGALRAEQGGYTLVNLQAAYRVTPAVTLALNVNNVFDKTYFRAISPSSANFYGEPLNVLMTLRARF